MPTDKLTDQAIRKAKPAEGKVKLSDGAGLYLELWPNGARYWRLKYRLAGVEKRLSLGVYPDVTLADARRRRDEHRRMLADGMDPSQVRRESKQAQQAAAEAARRDEEGLAPAGSFEAVAREWHEIRKGDWSASYAGKIMDRLEADIFPYVGRRPVAAIAAPDLLAVLRRIEARGAIETAHRARENCSQVFRFAVASGRAERDPAADLKDALRKPVVKHFPAITKPERLAELLRAMWAYQGTPVVRAALRLAPLLLLRPGELRHAQWPEIDLESATWTVPAKKMKREKVGKEQGPPHIVPLPTQAVSVFADLRALTGMSPFAFRGERHHDRPMSENTVNAALRAMGFGADEVTGHGFRATARTILAERLGVDEAVIEAQLAHSVKDSLGRAYRRASACRNSSTCSGGSGKTAAPRGAAASPGSPRRWNSRSPIRRPMTSG